MTVTNDEFLEADLDRLRAMSPVEREAHRDEVDAKIGELQGRRRELDQDVRFMSGHIRTLETIKNRVEFLESQGADISDTSWLLRQFGQPIKWGNAIELRHEQNKLWQGETGQLYAETLARTGDWGSDLSASARSDTTLQAQRTTFAQAETTWVSVEMVDLVEAASTSLPSETALAMEDLAFGACFAVFERPAVVKDQDGSILPLDAIAWTPMYSTVDECNGLIVSLYAFWYHLPFLKSETYKVSEAHRRGFPDLYMLRTGIFLPFDRPYTDVEQSNVDQSILSFAVSLATLMGQPISELEERHAPRAIKRRLEREHGETPSPISVLTLRRPAGSSSSDGEGRDWSHRWVVGSHWRRQWYPSIQRHRSILINAYVKGPEDKPLVVKERVYKWVR